MDAFYEYYKKVSALYWAAIEKDEGVPTWLYDAYNNANFIMMHSGSTSLQYSV